MQLIAIVRTVLFFYITSRITNVCSLAYNQFNSSVNFHVKQAQFARHGLSSIFWEFIKSVEFSKLNLSPNCIQSLAHVTVSLQQERQWTLKLMDASGRIPRYITGGGYLDTGSFDKCLDLSWQGPNDSTEIGQYCLISLLPQLESNDFSDNIYTKRKIIDVHSDLVIKIGLCLPSSCSQSDLHEITSKALKQYYWDLKKIDNCQVKTSFSEKFHRSPLSRKVTFLAVFAVILTTLTSTLLDWFEHLGAPQISNIGKPNWINHFSIIRNYQTLINSDPSDRLPYTTWTIFRNHCSVLFIHITNWPFITNNITFFAAVYEPLRYLLETITRNWYGYWFTDWLFLYGGTMRSMQLWKKTNANTSLLTSFKLVYSKFFYLSLIIGILIVTLDLIPLFANGPYAPNILERSVESCLPNIFYYIGLAQNNIKPVDMHVNMCIMPTWSVAAEFQLVPFLIILIHLYKKRPTIGLIVNFCLIIGGLLYNMQQFYQSNIGPFTLSKPFNAVNMTIWIHNLYFPSLMHLWMYALSVLWTYLIMTRDFSSWYMQILIKNAQWKMLFSVSILMLWPITWSKFVAPFETRFLVAIWTGIYLLITGIFFTFDTLSNRDMYKKYFSHSQDRKQNNLATELNGEKLSADEKKVDSKGKQEKLFSEPGNISKEAPHYIRNHKIYYILSILMGSTYFSHYTLITWYHSQMKWPITTLPELIIDCFWQITLSICFGILFYFTILAPLSNIYTAIIGKKIKSHGN